MRVALVHDYLNQFAGAERVLGVLARMFPAAPIYTLVYDDELTGRAFRGRTIRTSFLQRWPFARRHHRLFLLAMPMAIETFSFAEYDLVISDSASFAKGIITKPTTLHLNYCHTPTRYLWLDTHKHVAEFPAPRLARRLMPLALNYLRLWDREASARVDYFIANSRCVAERIGKFYNRSAAVIYPPVATERFGLGGTPKNFYLMVGRMLPYKRFDVAIEAFNELGYPLKIIGDGPEMARLRRLAKRNVEFVGKVSDERLGWFYRHAVALIFPGEEDFGLAPVEAMACGRPVAAFRRGGALETVVEGVTGIFFEEQSAAAIITAVRRLERSHFDPHAIRAHARSFDESVFEERMRRFIERAWQEWRGVRVPIEIASRPTFARV
ncbi:glycosyltransferase [Candidatus Parcubacteria bacterium]|nr:glycosyltransferase [Candidatus Parcubacteria bacterium]